MMKAKGTNKIQSLDIRIPLGRQSYDSQKLNYRAYSYSKKQRERTNTLLLEKEVTSERY